jgi:hypothetical protein
MTKSLLAVVLLLAAAIAGNAGVKLAGALRQVGVIAGAQRPVHGAQPVVAASHAAPERAAVAAEAAARPEPVRAPPPSSTPVAPAEEPVPLAAPELPGPAFAPEAALHAAAESDPNVGKLLNDGDPAVGAAVRDLVYTLSAPGASARSR